MDHMPKYRPIYEIAAEIIADWEKVYFSAVPYLTIMHRLDKIEDHYGWGRTVVMNFLSNAGSWRGENARRIKAELKKMANLK